MSSSTPTPSTSKPNDPVDRVLNLSGLTQYGGPVRECPNTYAKRFGRFGGHIRT